MKNLVLKMALHGIAYEEKAINSQYIEPLYMKESNPLGPASNCIESIF
jgi:hypothetical protein